MVEGSLQGKVAIVTGAGSPIGIGHAIALGLVRAGARVALLDVNKEWLDESVNEVRELGGDEVAVPIVADVTDAEAVERAVGTTISELGGVHILFNNAGIYPRWPGFAPTDWTNFWDHTPEAWSRSVAVNLSGPFLMARAVVGHLRAQRWGRIIGVTTSLGTMWLKGGSPYGPSKAGHEALVAIMAQELEGTGVTANVLVPGGATHSNITASRFARADLMQPEMMAAPAVWLASDASSNVNGRRFIAVDWDEDLPLEERLRKAGAPAAWPQLGQQAIQPDGKKDRLRRRD